MESKETLQLETDFIYALLKDDEEEKKAARAAAIKKSKKKRQRAKRAIRQLALF